MFEEVWNEGRLEEHLDRVYPRGRTLPWLNVHGGAAPGAITPSYTHLAVARAAGRVARASGHGGGTTAPGRLLLRIAPAALRSLSGRLEAGATVITGTNGKTTSARMLASVLEAAGRPAVHNRAGANTHWGVATALLDGAGADGVFEVDEAWMPLVAHEIRPRVIVLGNLFRDRLDGYGEIEWLIRVWRDLLRQVGSTARVVANADDPLLCGGAAVVDVSAMRPLLFGVEDTAVGLAAPEHPHEGRVCRACDGSLSYSRAFVGHLGHYRCAWCGAVRPRPDVRALAIRHHAADRVEVHIETPGAAFDVDLAGGGLHTVYNALAATAAAIQLGVDADAIAAGLSASRPAFGRGERYDLRGRRIHLQLVKNPVGVNETLRVLQRHAADGPLHLWLALNDGEADGRDVSWIWDCDFESLHGAVAMVTCSGRRAAELALRLKYAGWPRDAIVDGRLDSSFERALAGAPHVLFMLPTYSALLGLRAVLRGHGLALTDWGASAASSQQSSYSRDSQPVR